MVLVTDVNEIVVPVLIVLGLTIAVLSILERRVKWVQRFCAFFGEGCRRTARFTLLGLSLSWWGVAYYVALGFVFFLVRPLLFWAVMAGFGIEVTFVATMIAIRALCVFCALNSIVVILLTVATFEPRWAGWGLLLAAVAFAASLAALFRENRVHFRRPPKEDVLSEIEEEAEKGENPALGPKDATVEVIEFSDYLCPVCRQARSMVARIRGEFEGRIRWVYMDFPLEMHEGSKEIARAPRCAGEQGQFWPFQELLLGAEGRPGPGELEDMAAKIGLDAGRFRACLAGDRHRDEIERDIAQGVAAGVSATPTFLVNGKALEAPGYEQLRAAIEGALSAARETPPAKKGPRA